jgi:hypothetical protein
MWRVWDTGEVHTGFGWGDPREGDYLQDLGVDERVIFKYTFKKWVGQAWTTLFWLKIRTGGGLFWIQ